MNEEKFKIKTSKFKNNILLKRKQFLIEISHPENSDISKKILQKKLAEIYKIQDPSLVFLFGFRTHFGGKRTTGIGFIYQTLFSARQIEPRFRLKRNNLIEIKRASAKQIKEKKNRAKKIRGKEKKKVKNGK
jgi:small subunit ribosomal protein S24e